MTNFKVGDKVRILDASGIDGAVENGLNTGDITELIKTPAGNIGIQSKTTSYPVRLLNCEFPYIELVSDKPTKNQRISALESKVAELQAEVEVLKKAKSPKYTLEELVAKTPTPNEQRKAIIAEAKAFVAKYEGRVIKDGETPTSDTAGNIYVDLHVNANKRIVTAVVRWVYVSGVRDTVFAKCAPDDVFNEHIGKAIALGRALGLDVSKFENAVKPTELAEGHVIKYIDNGSLTGQTREITEVLNHRIGFSNGQKFSTWSCDGIDSYVNKAFVIDEDTEAQY